MNKSSLWVVIVVITAWIAFLFGYAVSSHTGGAKTGAGGAPAAESAGAGGYGAPAAGGYGK